MKEENQNQNLNLSNLNETNLNDITEYVEEIPFLYPDNYDDKPIIPDYAYQYLDENTQDYAYLDIPEYEIPDIEIPEVDREQEMAQAIEEAHFKATHEVDRIAMLIQKLDNPDKEPIPIYKEVPEPVRDIPQEAWQYIEDTHFIYEEEIIDAPVIEEDIEDKLKGLFAPTPEEKVIDQKVIEEAIDNNTIKQLTDEEKGIFNVNILNIKYDNNRELILNKKCYTSKALVDETQLSKRAVESISKAYMDRMEKYGALNNRNKYFIEEVVKTVFGRPKDNSITNISQVCGGGKSVGIEEIIRFQIQEIKEGNTTNGIIVISEFKDNLRRIIDAMKEEDKKYIYLVESGDASICINEEVKNKVRKKDDIFRFCYKCQCNECKIHKQYEEQKQAPILLITTKRADLIQENINKYEVWGDDNRRNFLFIDERPVIVDYLLLSLKNVNDIYNHVSSMDFEGNMEDKTKLLQYFKEIEDKITAIFDSNRIKLSRRVLNNQYKTLTSNDDEFQELWEKYVGTFLYREQLQIIKQAVTGEALFINTEKIDYVTTIKHRDLNNQFSHFRTFIFDATSLIDPQYDCFSERQMKYLYLPSDEEFKHLVIDFIANLNISKTKVDNDKKDVLAKKISLYLNRLNYSDKFRCYAVTFQKLANQIKIDQEKQKYFLMDYEEEIRKCEEKMYNSKGEEVEGLLQNKKVNYIYHYGNTKGKNIKDENNQLANIMFGFGYPKLADHDTLVYYLSTTTKDKKEEILKLFKTNDEEALKRFSEQSRKLIRDLKTYKEVDTAESNKNTKLWYNSRQDYLNKTTALRRFGFEGLNKWEYRYLITNLFQEIYRTQLRLHDPDKDVLVELWGYDEVIRLMLEQLFPNCWIGFNKDVPIEFCNIKKGSNAEKVLNYILNLEIGTIFKLEDLLESTGLDNRKFQDTIKRNKILKIWFDTHKVEDKKGYYKA